MPMDRSLYPADWEKISERIRFGRARGRCECRGECGRSSEHLDTDARCVNRHGQPIIVNGVPVELLGNRGRVVLTTAHLDHTPEHCDDDNLRAFCQACHFNYDRAHHAQTRRATARRELSEQMESLEEPIRRRPDLTRLRNLGWEPTVLLDAGLTATIDWVREVTNGR